MNPLYPYILGKLKALRVSAFFGDGLTKKSPGRGGKKPV